MTNDIKLTGNPSSSSGSAAAPSHSDQIITYQTDRKQIPVLRLSPAQRKEYFQTHSLLSKKGHEPAWKALLTNKLVAHIENGTDIRETSLEGENLRNTMGFLGSYLKDRHSGIAPIQGAIRLLDQYPNNDRLTGDQMHQAVMQLKAGEEILLPSGWSKQPCGHAMLIHIQRTASGNFDLTVFNTGDGNKFHPVQFGVNNKRRIQPAITYKEVVPEEINLTFFKFLKRFRDTCPVTDKESEALYNHVFNHLDAKKETVAFTTPLGFISEQRAGTCAWNVAKAFLFWYLMRSAPGEERAAIYKWIHFHLKEDVAVAAFEKIASGQVPNFEFDTALLLVKDAAKNLARSVAKNYSEKGPSIIKREEAEEGVATALDILERLDGIEGTLSKERRNAVIPVPDFTKEPPTQTDLKKLIDSQDLGLKKDAIPEMQSTFLPMLPSPAPEQTGMFLYALIAQIEMLTLGDLKQDYVIEPGQARDPLSAILQIENSVKLLPIPIKGDDPFWDSVPLEDIPKCLARLDLILARYTQLSGQSTSLTKLNTAYSLIAIIHKLSVRHEKALYGRSPLEEKGINVELFLQAPQDPFHIYFDLNQQSRRMNLFHYFDSVKGPLFNFGRIDQVADGSVVDRNPDDYAYFKELTDGGSPARNSLMDLLREKADRLYEAYPKKYQRNTLMYIGFMSDANIPTKLDSPLLHTITLRRALLHGLMFSLLPEAGTSREPNYRDRHVAVDIECTAGGGMAQDIVSFKYKTKLYSQGPNPQFEDNEQAEIPFYTGISEAYHLKEKARCQENHHYAPGDSRHDLRQKAGYLDLFNRAPRDTESEVMKGDQAGDDKIPISKFLTAPHRSPLFFPRKILYYYLNNIIELSNPVSQLIFDMLLFKPLVYSTSAGEEEETYPFNLLLEGEKSLLGNEEKLPPLFKQCRDLIQKGLNHFYLSRPRGQVDINSVLFFVRLAQRLSQSYPNAFPTLMRDIDAAFETWLKKDVPIEQKCLIHLHRALNGIVLANQTGDIKPYLKNILASWFYFQKAAIPEELREKDIEERVRQFLFDRGLQIQDLLSDQKFRDEVFSEIFKVSEIQNSFNASWKEEKFPLYSIETPDYFWRINLAKAQIANREGIIQGEKLDLTQSPNYTHLFGNTVYNMNKTGDTYYFIHPIYGSMELVLQKKDREIDVLIRRQDPQTQEWYQFIRPAGLQKYFPNALISDHSQWFPLGKKDSVRFLDGKTGEEAAIVSTDQPYVVHLKNGNTAVYRDQNWNFIKKFEEPKWITLEENQGRPVKLNFPRFQSLQKKALSFSQKDGNFHWEENPKFILSDHRGGMLGRIDNYLLLANGQKRKLLVPLQKMAHAESRTSIVTIDKAPDNANWKGNLNSQYFIEFDLKGKTPIPLNLEGQLFLAYLELSQKNYEKAAKILKALSQSQEFSLKSLDILRWIMEQGRFQVIDQAPSAAAVRLSASLLLWTLQTREHTFPKTFQMDEVEWKKMVQTDYCGYLSALAHVPEELRLPSDDEKMVISKISYNEPIIYREEFLNKAASSVEYTYPIRSIFDPILPDYFRDFKEMRVGNNFDRIQLQDYHAQDILPFIPTWFGKFYREAKTIGTQTEYLAFVKKMELILYFPQPEYNPKEPEKIEKELFYLLLFTARANLVNKELCPELPRDIPWENHNHWICELLKVYQNNRQFYQPAAQIARLSSKIDPNAPKILAANSLPANVTSIGGKKEAGGTISQLLAGVSSSQVEGVHRLFEENFKSSTIPVRDYSAYLEWTEKDALQGDDKDFEAPLKGEIKALSHSYGVGTEKMKKEPHYIFQGNLPDLQKNLSREKHALEIDLKQRRKALLQAANSTPSLLTQALHLGGTLKILSMTDLKNLLLLDSLEAFRNATRGAFQSDQEIAAFIKDLIEYEMRLISLKQIDRSLAHIEKLKDAPKDELPGLQTALADELRAETHYNPYRDFTSLIFEDRADLKLRKNQVEGLDQLCKTRNPIFMNAIKQMMMGGGKTAVLAANILFRMAKNGIIPIFVVPAAQYESVKQNLISSQKRIFNQDIAAIDISWKEISPGSLEWILKQMQTAREKEQFILMKKELIQALEAEYIAAIHSTSTYNPVLKKILLELKTQGLLDEVDFLLKTDNELNRPVGKAEPLPPAKVDLLGKIYEYQVSEDIVVDGKSINQWIGLRNNRQSSLDTEFYKKKILPKILEKLVSYEPLQIKESEKEDFIAYVTGKLPEGHPFALAAEGKGEKAELLDCLSKLCDEKNGVLAHTLTLSTGRHYGRNPSLGDGAVSPFLGVGTPASTQFASVEKLGALHLATALCLGVTLEQVRFTYKMYLRAAENRANAATPLNDTQAAKRWQEITGCPLSDMEEGDNMSKALKTINSGPISTILEIEKDTIANTVTYYSEYVSSNPQNFFSQFQNVIGVTGTPWNAITFDKSLQDNLFAEVEVPGLITQRMFDTVTPESFHVVEKADIPSFLESALAKSPNFDRVRALIDVGGLLKNVPSNITVAQQILEFYKNDPDIQYVLYFDRKDPKDSPDHLMVLRKDAPEIPIFIGKTRKEELEKFHIDPKLAFIYFDERHTEATDLPMMARAVCLKTVGKDVQMRSDHQASMRARKYLTSQECEYLILREEMPSFVGNLPAEFVKMQQDPKKENACQVLRCILYTYLLNEGKRKSNLNLRAFQQKIDNVVRKTGKEQILADDARAKQVLDKYLPVFVTKKSDRKGSAAKPEPTKKMLAGFVDKRIKMLEDLGAPRAAIQELDALKEEISKSVYLPETTTGDLGNLNAQQQIVQNQTVVEQNNVENSVEIESEIEQELNRFNIDGNMDTYQETKWKKAHVLTPDDTATPIFPVPQIFQKTPDTAFSYEAPYGSLFSPNLLITKNMMQSTVTQMPVFHKSQKIADQIVVIAEVGKPLRFQLVTVQESHFFESYLQKEKPQDRWLMFANGDKISMHPHRELTPAEQTQFDELLIQANLFAGNVRILDQNTKKALAYFKKIDRKLAIRYLKLKVLSIPLDKKILTSSSFLSEEIRERAAVPSAAAAPSPRRTIPRPALERKYNDPEEN